MLNYFIKALFMVTAIIYSVFTVGLSMIPETEDNASPLFLPQESIVRHPTLYVLQNREDISFELQQAFELYSKKNPNGTTFSVSTISGEYDYTSALRSRLLSGEDADLFLLSGARELNELRPHISPLDFLPWVQSAYKPSLDAVTLDGTVYAVPYSLEATGFVCNRDIFEAAGIPLADIQSFEALSEAFETLSEEISSGGLKDSFPELEAVCGFPAADKAFLGGVFADIALTGAFSSPHEAAASSNLTFPAKSPVEELLKLIVKNTASKNDWPSLTMSSATFETQRLASGKIAVLLSDTNIYKRINELNPQLKGRLFLMPVPLNTYEMPSVYVGSPGYWAISGGCSEDEKQTAGDFLNWLYLSEEGADFFAERFEAVSPFREAAKDTGAALHSQMLSYINSDLILPSLYRELPRDWRRDVFASGIQDYLKIREATWEQVISKSEEAWREQD